MDKVRQNIFFFGKTKVDGHRDMVATLGGKGAQLAEMCRLGCPVPPGFTLGTHLSVSCSQGQSIPDDLKNEIKQAIADLEKETQKSFGSAHSPLLVSVRSGARASMPGMMDTVLNLGLNDAVTEGLAQSSGDPRFAYDCYRRFIQMYGDVVQGVSPHCFGDAWERLKQKRGYTQDSQLTPADLRQACTLFKDIYKEETRHPFPTDPYDQLWSAITAVFKSWNSDRARKYREIQNIPHDWGTAVNVCSMVYGNRGPTSGTGVCFTRDPSTGENVFYGEYLLNAQGEDVVAGIRTPHPLAQLKDDLPAVYKQLEQLRTQLETHYRDVQDIEFTIEDGHLFVLQTRSAKRTVQAALKIAIDMVEQGIITKSQALQRVSPQDLDKLLHPTLDPRSHKQVIGKGLPASPGAGCGRVVFSASDAENWANKGEAVILVRDETSPEDIGGMHAAKGFLTARGGMTSHAAVVARQMGKCCVAGCSQMHISYGARSFKLGSVEVFEGDWLTLDGATGEVILGKLATKEADLSHDFQKFMTWASEAKRLGVYANADTPKDAALARRFGAQGIGLCRTEHMFFDEERLPLVREMILSKNLAERTKYLQKLLPFQRQDFAAIMEAMDGLPVVIRLLDPPLHEFLPHDERELRALAKDMQIEAEELRNRVKQLSESNPMLGHRGCRLGITYPEIYEMQVQAIVEARDSLQQRGLSPRPEIMIPLVGLPTELQWLRKRLSPHAPGIAMGTMIEVPRAALCAGAIAEHADFFSFGTNDLTQTTFGFSRDDSSPFLKTYRSEGILDADPFAELDISGVGQLIELGIKGGLASKPHLKTGVCGEHGGDPRSVPFFHKVGIHYVSCSPFRVPIAILSAARSALNDLTENERDQ